MSGLMVWIIEPYVRRLSRLLLGKMEGDLSADRHSMPCLLQKLENDGSLTKGPPGYEVSIYNRLTKAFIVCI